MINEKMELIIKIVVLCLVVIIFLSSFNMKGKGYLKPVIMAGVATGAIVDLMGRFGKGLGFSLFFLLITVIVIWEKKNKNINNHEKV